MRKRRGRGVGVVMEELSFGPSAVSRSAGWHESKFMCDRKCRKEGFKFYDIASVKWKTTTVNGYLKKCHNLRHDAKEEPAISHKRRKSSVA